MNLLIENWYIILIAAAAALWAFMVVYDLLMNPSKQQLANVTEWLLWAVTNAEKELGGGTGQLKLRQVYDMFLLRFPELVDRIPFDDFSQLVDTALITMRKMLGENTAVQSYVSGDEPATP